MTLFNGTYTLTGPRGHRTVQVATLKNGDLAGRRAAKLFVGTDNTDYRHYKMIAWATDDGLQVCYKYRDHQDYCAIVKAFNKIVLHGGIDGYAFDMSKACRRCNRMLTNPASLKTGIGPECAGRA